MTHDVAEVVCLRQLLLAAVSMSVVMAPLTGSTLHTYTPRSHLLAGNC
jgi:hypothetical protein